MQDVPSAVLQPTEVILAKRFLSAKKSVICDVRMEKFTLKKLTALFLALLMLVSMCACASPASTEDAYQAKVALCLVTPVNDGAWSQLAYDAVMKAKDTYNISVKYTENIKPTEMEAVFTDYASQGYDLIIGHSFSFGDAALAVLVFPSPVCQSPAPIAGFLSAKTVGVEDRLPQRPLFLHLCDPFSSAAYCSRSFSACSQTALFRTSSWLR